MNDIPEPLERPSLAEWMWRRDLKPPQVARLLDVSAEQVRRYCLPFGHPNRSLPGGEILKRIERLTDGQVRERDFYPPHIRGVSPAPEVIQ